MGISQNSWRSLPLGFSYTIASCLSYISAMPGRWLLGFRPPYSPLLSLPQCLQWTVNVFSSWKCYEISAVSRTSLLAGPHFQRDGCVWAVFQAPRAWSFTSTDTPGSSHCGAVVRRQSLVAALSFLGRHTTSRELILGGLSWSSLLCALGASPGT